VPPDSPQKGSIDLLLTSGGIKDVVFRSGSLWVSATSGCIPSGDAVKRACLRVLELVQQGGSFSVNQNIEYGAAGAYYFYPALTVDPDNAVVVGFGASSPAIYPAFWATGRRTSDAPNSLRMPQVIEVGQAAYTNGDGVVDVLPW